LGRCAGGEPDLVSLVEMDTALHIAAEDGDVEEVITLVEEGADVEAADAGGWRVLHIAAADGHVEVARTLLEAGAHLEAQTARGSKPLYLAAQRGHVEVLRTLLEAGADVEAQAADGFRPLHVAAQDGHVEVARTLLEAGAGLEAQAAGSTPLDIAAQHGGVEVVRTLVAAGADLGAADGDGEKPLHLAALGGCAETIGALLELEVDIHDLTEDGRTALHCASSSEAVQALLEAGAYLHHRNIWGATPLCEAARHGYVPAVTALVQAGACPTASDAVWWIELIVKAIEGDEEAVTALAAAAEELTRRLEENGHFARTAVQIAELAHPAAEALRLALTRA
jgi:ankyrin repeat protein